MSRGYGYVQRFVLEELDRRWVGGEPWVHTGELAERLEGDRPTRHTCRSVRRALRLLAADGLVEIGCSARTGGRDHAMARIALARVDEVARRRRRRAEARSFAVCCRSARRDVARRHGPSSLAREPLPPPYWRRDRGRRCGLGGALPGFLGRGPRAARRSRARPRGARGGRSRALVARRRRRHDRGASARVSPLPGARRTSSVRRASRAPSPGIRSCSEAVRP